MIVMPSPAGGGATAARRRHHDRANLKQNRGYMGREKSLYSTFRLISCRPRLGTRPGGLGELTLFCDYLCLESAQGNSIYY
jgi:hypothetical protein